MKRGEDGKIALRWMVGRPVETLLLVLGISLGIGATAAGVALAMRTSADAREQLASTEYREIVVTAREEANDMEAPAVERTTTETIVLTTSDLSARDDAEDIQYAYVANRMELRLGDFGMPGGDPGQGGAPPDGATEADAQGAAPTTQATSQAPTQAAAQTTVTLDGPEPLLDEIRGYEVSPEFFTAWKLSASQGSTFTLSDIKKAEPIVVLGSTIAATLFEDGQSLGRQILSRGRLYTITGILEPSSTEYDSMAFTPVVMAELTGYEALARMSPSFGTSLHFTVTDSSRLEQAKAQLESWFEAEYGAGAVVVSVPRYEAEATRDRTSRLVTVILFLALSALLIAAVNVTNILYSRAMRKRRAVGVLKALGASARAVFGLFFREALAIGVGGAAVGAALSVLLSKLMQQTTGLAGVTAGLLALGIAGAIALVTTLDILPAMQASRIPASEAIRYE